MPKIYNKRNGDAPADAVYVGRSRNRYHYGNPFTHLPTRTRAQVQVATREEAVQAFEDWFDGKAFHDIERDRRWWIINNVKRLAGKDLECWCAPQRCHAEVLMRKAEEAKANEDKRMALLKANAEYCASEGYPKFEQGECWHCHCDIVAYYGDAYATTFVTGCPRCNRTFCD